MRTSAREINNWEEGVAFYRRVERWDSRGRGLFVWAFAGAQGCGLLPDIHALVMQMSRDHPGIPFNGRAGHNDIASTLEDLLSPAEHTRWALNGLPLRLAYAPATHQQKRLSVGIFARPGRAWEFLRPIGPMTRRQLSTFAKNIGTPWKPTLLSRLPRKQGAPITNYAVQRQA